MAKRNNPFITKGTLNGKPTTFDNTNQGVLYPRSDIRQGAMLGSFNHAGTGKKLTLLATPTRDGYGILVHEGPTVIERGFLKKTGGKVAFAGLLGQTPIVAFIANNQYGSYLQVRPDKRDLEQLEQQKAATLDMLAQLDCQS